MDLSHQAALRHRRAYLMMFGASFFFATMAVCGREAGRQSDWRIAAVARAALVFLFALVVAKVARSQITWRGTRLLWIRSLAGSVSMLLTFYALTRAESVAIAITLTNTFPLWVTLLAWPVLRERPTAATVLALACAVIGVALIERPDRGELRWASLAALGASFCTAVVMLGLHRLKEIDSLAVVVHFSAVATVVCAAYAVVSGFVGSHVELMKLANPMMIMLLAGVGVFGTTGQILMTAAFRAAPPQRLAVVGLTQVLFALGYSLLLEADRIEATTIVGIALVVTPVAWLVARGEHSA
jgi:drug/metabolite transporter (DMT)-like permease